MHKYRVLRQFMPNPRGRKIAILTGARQTGKTTLTREMYPELRYINLDSPENRETVRNIPSSFWARDVGNAAIDEAQKEPVVFEKVKYAYDDKGITFCIMLGSSQILFLKKIRESLAGRAAIYELWPLLMCEMHSDGKKDFKMPLVEELFSNQDLSKTFAAFPAFLIDKDDSSSRETENHILQWGGLPALLPLSNDERWKWLKDYEYTYLERDLSDLARLDDLEPFRKFQKLSSLRSARLLNYSELARDAAVSVDTARRYLEYLRLSYQVILLQPYYKNITSSVIKTPKLYWLDVGLLRQLSGCRGEFSGEIYETMVVAELYKWIKTTQKNAELYFYRTRSGLEMDILLQTEYGFIGIEIKSRASISSKDLRPLKEISAGLGKKWRGGLIVYQGNEIRKIAEPDIWAIPARRLFV